MAPRHLECLYAIYCPLQPLQRIRTVSSEVLVNKEIDHFTTAKCLTGRLKGRECEGRCIRLYIHLARDCGAYHSRATRRHGMRHDRGDIEDMTDL